jgi:hypothetical protein
MVLLPQGFQFDGHHGAIVGGGQIARAPFSYGGIKGQAIVDCR